MNQKKLKNEQPLKGNYGELQYHTDPQPFPEDFTSAAVWPLPSLAAALNQGFPVSCCIEVAE